jgi:hypothetical protein
MNRKILNKAHEYALSGQDIKNILDDKVNILTYPQLSQYININDVLTIDKPLIILYLLHSWSYGHWVALIKHNDRIEFFDSYGIPIDKQLNNIKDKNFKIESNQDYPYLLKLLYDSNQKIEFNHTPLQKMKKDNIESVATCGRHSAVRCYFKQMKLKDYIKFIKSMTTKSTDADDVVSFLTLNLNN